MKLCKCPPPGQLALYQAQTQSKSRIVRVLAEGSTGYMVVESIGKRGKPVQLTVKQENLLPAPHDLLSELTP